MLKKYYKPVVRRADRPVLEHLLFACCLEDARYEEAEEAFAALVHTFFDWNEIRVTSITELAEVMAACPTRARPPTASSASCTASSRTPTPSTWKTSARRTSGRP